jgi:hypothetical protein
VTIQFAMCVIAALALGVPATASADMPGLEGRPPLELRLTRLEAELDAQAEARDRQADAFDAAISRIEVVDGALVAIIALAAVLGALLAIRWVRELAHRQIAAQIETTVEERGGMMFEEEAAELREEYDEKFATLYRRYHRLVDEVQ